MRIVAAHPGPNFSVHDVHVGWTEALRQLGQHVVEFNLAERLTFYDHVMFEHDGESRKALSGDQAIEFAVNGLYATLYKVRPHLLLCTSGFFYPPDIFERARSYGTKVVVLHTESPYEDNRQMDVAGYADLNLINDPTNLVAFQSVAPTRYVPHSYRPDVHCPGPVDLGLASDLAFVGTGYQSRIKFLEAMDLSGVDVLLAGNWKLLDADSPLRTHLVHDEEECLDNEQTVNVYRSARCGLNMYRREADALHLAQGWSMGPREVEMAACGSFFLRDPRPEGDDVLSMLPTFEGPQDASEKLRFWLARPEDREALALKAREAVQDRTFTARAAELLTWLEH